MKKTRFFMVIGIGVLLSQSCSKQPAICDCVDQSTEMMQGERMTNYDGTFRKSYMKEKAHQEIDAKCSQLTSVVTDSEQEKLVKEMEHCTGYKTYIKELGKQLEHSGRKGL